MKKKGKCEGLIYDIAGGKWPKEMKVRKRKRKLKERVKEKYRIRKEEMRKSKERNGWGESERKLKEETMK